MGLMQGPLAPPAEAEVTRVANGLHSPLTPSPGTRTAEQSGCLIPTPQPVIASQNQSKVFAFAFVAVADRRPATGN